MDSDLTDGIVRIIELKDRFNKLKRISRAVLYHDERGQGVGYAEAMDDLKKFLEGEEKWDQYL